MASNWASQAARSASVMAPQRATTSARKRAARMAKRVGSRSNGGEMRGLNVFQRQPAPEAWRRNGRSTGG